MERESERKGWINFKKFHYLSINQHVYIYMYKGRSILYRYIDRYPQTDCFVVSQLLSVARNAEIETRLTQTPILDYTTQPRVLNITNRAVVYKYKENIYIYIYIYIYI